MKAIQYHRFGPPIVMKYEEAPIPLIKSGEVLVKVHYVSVNPKDCFLRMGKYKVISGTRFPQFLGSDLVGEVVATKNLPAAYPFKEGDRVYGMLPSLKVGSYAEYVRMKAKHLGHIPSQMAYREAAAIPLVGLTALQALRDLGQVQAGQSVFINGASGGVGTAGIQIAKVLGAEVTTTSSWRNLELCAQLGASQAIDYTKTSIDQLNGSFDVFFDAYGNQTLDKVRHLLTPNGRYVTTIPSLANFAQHALTCLNAQKSKVVAVKASGKDMDQLSEWIRAGKLHAVIDREFAIADVPDAHAYIQTKRARGKVILRVI